ncbi:hypothetical protein C1645_742445 [Glomus cerebriforme]|uniref:Uncharacterized protein n=1 Tax=Glomus cerebriforme TaxID=658196 RepID=A0A397SDD1_9GLOM|nr:hypothetical protein C1645_742445 [Glomus cerebriforme]
MKDQGELRLPKQLSIGNPKQDVYDFIEVARAVRSLIKASQAQSNQLKGKDEELEKLKQQLNQVQQQNTKLNNQLKEQHQQFQELFSILFLNNPYNFTKLKDEIKKFKIQELVPQVRSKRTELERLITNAKNNVEANFTGIIDLLCQIKKQIDEYESDEKTTDPLIQSHLKGQLTAYQNILQTKLTQEELNTILDKQTELFQLEKHLENLQK